MKSWNWRWVWGTVAVFAIFLLSDWLWNGQILKDWYASTHGLWRSQEDMWNHAWWYVTGLSLFSIVFTKIFTLNWENKGWMEGLRYGLWIALIFSSVQLMWFTFQPIPAKMMWTWIVEGFISFSIAGIAIAWFYKPSKWKSA